MTLLALTLAVVAVLLWIAPPPGWEPAGLPGSAVGVERRGGSRWRLLAVVTASLGGVLVTGWWLGRPAGVLTLCLGLAAATVARVGVTHRHRRAAEERAAEVARACAVLAAELRVGKIPTEALLTAAEDAPVLSRAAAVHRSGGDVVPALRALAATPGAAGLAPVAGAWQVSVRTGAPLTQALDQVTRALKADRAVHRLVAAELSAPRATGRMLALLPVAGLLLGFAIGGDPVSFLLGRWQGQLCLVLGVGLACGGVLWSERLAR